MEKISKPFVSGVIAAMLLAPTAFAAKKPPDLSAFKGNFRGEATLHIDGQSIPGSGSAGVKVSKAGASAIIAYRSRLSAEGQSLDFATTLSLSRNGIFTVSDIGLGLFGTPIPISGNYSRGKGRFSFSYSANGRTVFFSGEVHDRGSKRNLKLKIIYNSLKGSFTIDNDFTTTVPKH